MISIVIPVLNEEANLKELLPLLLDRAHDVSQLQIVVVDGGSEDNGYAFAKAFKQQHNNLITLQPGRGRALQLNAGSRAATGSILYHLHADTRPPQDYDKYIREAVEKGKAAGSFRLRFDYAHWWLWLASFLTRINHKAARGGDQSLWMRSNVFDDLNGYSEEYGVCEDVDLINRIYDSYGFTVLPHQVVTSARLYRRHGVFKLQYHFYMIYILKKLGRSPQHIHKYYKQHIA